MTPRSLPARLPRDCDCYPQEPRSVCGPAGVPARGPAARGWPPAVGPVPAPCRRTLAPPATRAPARSCSPATCGPAKVRPWQGGSRLGVRGICSLALMPDGCIHPPTEHIQPAPLCICPPTPNAAGLSFPRKTPPSSAVRRGVQGTFLAPRVLCQDAEGKLRQRESWEGMGHR